jgi:hypothetical protein
MALPVQLSAPPAISSGVIAVTLDICIGRVPLLLSVTCLGLLGLANVDGAEV